jgi:hypothetical protein
MDYKRKSAPPDVVGGLPPCATDVARARHRCDDGYLPIPRHGPAEGLLEEPML